MLRRVAKVLPLVIAGIGSATLMFGLGFIFFGHGLRPAGAISANLDGYRYVAAASFRLSHLADDAGLSLLVVGAALLALAWLADYWRRQARPRLI